MNRVIFLPSMAIAAILPSSGHAQISATSSVDRPNFEVSRSLERDPVTGIASRDVQVTRKSHGATANRTIDRTRTSDGGTFAATQTGFGGRTRGIDYTRSGTESGYVASGSVTGRGGRSAFYNADVARGTGGYSANRLLIGGGGRTLFSRELSRVRANGQVTSSSSTTRASGFGRRFRRHH